MRKDLQKAEIMNHKGKTCWLDNKTFCQEGYCAECWIHVKWDEMLKEIKSGRRFE